MKTKQLFVTRNVDFNFLKSIKKRYPLSKTIFWDGNETDLVAFKKVSDFFECVVVDDGIKEKVTELIGIKTESLGIFDEKLSSLAKKNELTINNKKPGIKAADNKFNIMNGPVLFCPLSDTHVKLLKPISVFLDNKRFFIFDDYLEENSKSMLNKLGVKFDLGNLKMLSEINPSVIVFANDWAQQCKDMIVEARKMGIPTVCIQEGNLDFNVFQRMKWCDYPFIQGPNIIDCLDQKIYFLTGNPKFDSLVPCKLPDKTKIMINCNFTYGVYEEERERWIGDVVNACRELKIDFFISQHPRDNNKFMDLPVEKSSPEKVHQHLRDCSILISRFSAVIYEALLLGRHVIYYNPHKEDMCAFNEDKTGAVNKINNKEELIQTVKRLIDAKFENQKLNTKQFLDLQCGAHDGNATKRCASAIAYLSNFKKSKSSTGFFQRIFNN